MREKIFYIAVTIFGLTIWTIGGLIEAMKDRLGVHARTIR